LFSIRFGKEEAAAIFNLFLECMPDYPINKADVDGNTRENIIILLLIGISESLCQIIEVSFKALPHKLRNNHANWELLLASQVSKYYVNHNVDRAQSNRSMSMVTRKRKTCLTLANKLI